MDNLHLCIASIDVEDSSKRTTNAIWGEINIRIDGTCYPSDVWYDCISSILDMWMDEIVGLICNKTKQCNLYFMDGPYVLQVTLISKNSTLFSFQANGERVHECMTNGLSDFVNDMLNCVMKFLDSCTRQVPYFTSTKNYARILKNYKMLRNMFDYTEGGLEI